MTYQSVCSQHSAKSVLNGLTESGPLVSVEPKKPSVKQYSCIRLGPWDILNNEDVGPLDLKIFVELSSSGGRILFMGLMCV